MANDYHCLSENLDYLKASVEFGNGLDDLDMDFIKLEIMFLDGLSHCKAQIRLVHVIQNEITPILHLEVKGVNTHIDVINRHYNHNSLDHHDIKQVILTLSDGVFPLHVPVDVEGSRFSQ